MITPTYTVEVLSVSDTIGNMYKKREASPKQALEKLPVKNRRVRLALSVRDDYKLKRRAIRDAILGNMKQVASKYFIYKQPHRKNNNGA